MPCAAARADAGASDTSRLGALWKPVWQWVLCGGIQGESKVLMVSAGTGAAVRTGRRKQAGWEGGKKRK